MRRCFSKITDCHLGFKNSNFLLVNFPTLLILTSLLQWVSISPTQVGCFFELIYSCSY
nr:putative molybdopterin biosynthesis CNX2 protein [Arabidopsis thaliana]